MNWKIKAVIQKSISILPYSYAINRSFQHYVTVGNDLPRSLFLDRLKVARLHIKTLTNFNTVNIQNAKILEIGTGWYPIIPIMFFLSGANNIETSDIKKLFNITSVNKTIRAFLDIYHTREIFSLIPDFQESRIEILKQSLLEKKLAKKLELLKIKCFFGPIYNKFNSSSKDLIVSNNTLQFLKPKELSLLFTQLKRIGKPYSILSLSIDYSDEFSHTDNSISKFNFLKFSALSWKIITCKLNNTNRLRHCDFRQIFIDNFQILEERIYDAHAEEIKKIKLAKIFLHYTLKDLLPRESHTILLNNKKS